MGYEHSLNADVNFKPAVTVETALSALKPLSDYRQWTQEALLTNNVPQEDTVEISAQDGVIQHMSIYSCGYVSYSFPDLVDSLAGNLNAIAQAGAIELRNHDTGDVENAITLVWYGDPVEVAQARRIHAWQESAALLRSVNTPDSVLDTMACVGGFGSSSPSVMVPNAGDIDAARLFWQELLASVETLTAIADQYGARTLADLLYLQNAMLSGGFVDHYPGESKVIDLARALPSGERWMTYIKVEYLDAPPHP